MKYKCPVCLTNSLKEPYTPNSYDICRMCGVEYGYEDATIPHTKLRQLWQEAGSPNWWDESEQPDFKGGVRWFDEYREKHSLEEE